MRLNESGVDYSYDTFSTGRKSRRLFVSPQRRQRLRGVRLGESRVRLELVASLCVRGSRSSQTRDFLFVEQSCAKTDGVAVEFQDKSDTRARVAGAMASGDPPSGLALLAEKAARAFEAGEYAEARRCVGDLELEARVGGNAMHPRDAARLAQNVAVLDFCDTEREGRLDAAGFRDTLRRAESAFEAASSSDAEPADPEADARVLRANLAWATMRGAFSDDVAASTIAVLERVFDDTVATDDGSSSTDTLHETLHVASMLLRALAASGSRADAEKALRILSIAEAVMCPPRRENANARSFLLRERARASMTLGDLATAREALRAIQTIQTTGQASSEGYPSDASSEDEELASLHARLAYLEGDGEAALRLFSLTKTAPRDDARALNLASVLELSGASATASFLLDSIRFSSRRRDDDDDADDRKTIEKRDDDDDDDDDVSRFKRAAAYRAGVTLLRAKKPAAAALLVLAGGTSAAAGAPETRGARRRSRRRRARSRRRVRRRERRRSPQLLRRADVPGLGARGVVSRRRRRSAFAKASS